MRYRLRPVREAELATRNSFEVNSNSHPSSKHYYGVHFAEFAEELTMLADEFRLLGPRQSMPAFAAEVGHRSAERRQI